MTEDPLPYIHCHPRITISTPHATPIATVGIIFCAQTPTHAVSGEQLAAWTNASWIAYTAPQLRGTTASDLKSNGWRLARSARLVPLIGGATVAAVTAATVFPMMSVALLPTSVTASTVTRPLAFMHDKQAPIALFQKKRAKTTG